MKTYHFHLKKRADPEVVWELMQNIGLEPLYHIQSSNENYIGANVPVCLPELAGIEKIEEVVLPPIDWTEQWQLHGADFDGGFVHVHTSAVNLKLEPGPGFGDLSHATTRLTLTMMSERVKGKNIVDVGSGSGVLTLAAAVMDAVSVLGIDCDAAAVEHARKNAVWNHLQGKVEFMHSEACGDIEWKKPLMVVMNMISSEQFAAMQQYDGLWNAADEMIVSGILDTERTGYLAQMYLKGWSLADTLIEGEWCALYLNKCF